MNSDISDSNSDLDKFLMDTDADTGLSMKSDTDRIRIFICIRHFLLFGYPTFFT